jgi:hypothetical protein
MATNTFTWNSELWGGSFTSPSGTVSTLPPEATSNRTLVRAALRKAGVTLAPGRGPSFEQIEEAVGEESRMIQGWNCSPLNIFTTAIDLYTTIANQQSHTIGIDPTGSVTADFNGPRPQSIVRANLLLPTAEDSISKVRRPLSIWDDRQWAALRYQAIYTYPEGMYYDGGCDPTTGFANIYFRPIPDAAYEIELYTWQAVPTFVGIDDSVILPPGYEDAIVNNLAVRLASMPWPVQVPMNPQVAVDAVRSLAVIQGLNASAPRLRSDAELTDGRGWFNWRSGSTER